MRTVSTLACKRIIRRVIEELEEEHGVDYLSEVDIQVSQRTTNRRLATAWPNRMKIAIYPKLHALSTPDPRAAKEYIEDSVRHELAHIHHYLQTGRSNHDAKWKEFALAFGARPEQYNNWTQVKAYREERFHNG